MMSAYEKDFLQKSDRKNESQEKIIGFPTNTLKKVSFERSEKILTESGLNPTDDEVKCKKWVLLIITANPDVDIIWLRIGQYGNLKELK